MKKVRLSELSDPVRAFLEELTPGESIAVEDDNGQLRCGITPYYEATPQERTAAWQRLESLQQRVAQAMRDQNITEEDIDRVIQQDD